MKTFLHADHVIVRVRRKDKHALRKDRIGWTIDIAGTLFTGWFPARPAGDRLGHPAEDIDVDVVRRPVRRQQILQAVFVIVFVREFQDRLLDVF